ncbi:MAG TPA: HD-GYP domain-containing protein [Thiobacillaceae bacterium]|nr:HD-GYP domain-containing protein [Thiobacillaceae bacterium]HNU63366.1 HD-GYP domain-containing protein [Thiobacillaceae bacterium]
MDARDQRIGIDQLRVGLYIRLEDWMEHPFLFNSFKIRNEKQLKTLRSLGIQHVIYVREKSDLAPLPAPVGDAPSAPRSPAQPDPEVAAMWQAKKARREKLSLQREALGRCEKRFSTGMATVKGLLRDLFSRPAQSLAQAQGLVAEMVDSLLAEKDVVLHLMNAKAGDENAYYHVLNVTVLSLMLGKAAGLDAETMRDLGLGALLHDLGKEKVPSQILLKKTAWSTAERNFYQQHVRYGVEMARLLPGIAPSVLEVVAMHHELLDGTGFPDRLQAEGIGLLARIVCIANAFDNYCNRVNPADSMSPAEAIRYMFRREAGKYDARLMQLFIQAMGVYPPGSLVQLSNGAIGLVMSVNPGRLLHPGLLLHDPDVPKEEALWLDLAEMEDLKVEKVLRPDELDRAVYDYLQPRSRVNYFAESSVSTKRTQ